ncbi:MAG: hypothetical protein PHU64_03035 [Candidatus Omnitrophica bacterium]|nr:hypothetical protein [Candidatus Omnitrophota bacterium]MDD5429352.1 hypothetical protein [Candidatus Omnitrophota bacterium]
MVYWVPFLHFYQPSIQFHSVLKKIFSESYRPLLEVYLRRPEAKATINVSGVLTDLLDEHGGSDIIEGMTKLAKNSQIEFVESAKYHTILPLISPKEAKRQLKLNHKTNENFFGRFYRPKGAFPPEMCYSARVARILASAGYNWVLVSGIANQDIWPMDFISRVKLGGQAINVLYRDDIISNKISFRNLDSIGFINELRELTKDKKNAYVITAMDAETFGHHIKGWEDKFLARTYDIIKGMRDIRDKYSRGQPERISAACRKEFKGLKEFFDIKVATISELFKKFPIKNSKLPRPSSWSTTNQDISKKKFYPLWLDEDNICHRFQWEHLKEACRFVYAAEKIKGSNKQSKRFAVIARISLDKALFSCQFWWANKETGRWDINLINKGLILQEEAILNSLMAINYSSAGDIKKAFQERITACRRIAANLRDAMLAV